MSGSFSIVINARKSAVDMIYAIKFQDVTHEKPSNMNFKIRGSNKIYSTLQELEKDLNGIIKKQTENEIYIDWQWPYETGENEEFIMKNNKIDTIEGKKLQSYKFKIIVTGEEAI